jgi:hypothetical protein
LEDWSGAEPELLHSVRLEIAEFPMTIGSFGLTITGKHQAQQESNQGKTIYSE